MPVRVKYQSNRGLYQLQGTVNSAQAAVEISPSQADQEILSFESNRGVCFKTSQETGVREASGSLLSLKGRQEGLYFHVGGNQYISNNSWFNANHPETDAGRWVYETTSGGAFRWGFLSSTGMFELDWAKSGVAGQVITGSANASWGTGLSMTASNGAIGIGKRAKNGLSATLDITGSNSVAIAVTGSADFGGGAPDAFFALPRLTNDQRNALTDVFDGQVIYNITAGKFQGRAAGVWVNLH